MMRVKQYCTLLVTLFLMFFYFSTNAYALMNMEAYIGNSFAGQIAGLDAENNVSGLNYGFRLNGLYRITLFDFGLGTYMQATPLTYKLNGETYELNKLSLGLDSFVRFKPELLPIFPYIRSGIALYDKSETTLLNSEDITTVSEFKFDASYYGFGVSYPMVPMPIIDVHFFLEYLYDISRVTHETELKCHKLNFGLFMSI